MMPGSTISDTTQPTRALRSFARMMAALLGPSSLPAAAGPATTTLVNSSAQGLLLSSGCSGLARSSLLMLTWRLLTTWDATWDVWREGVSDCLFLLESLVVGAYTFPSRSLGSDGIVVHKCRSLAILVLAQKNIRYLLGRKERLMSHNVQEVGTAELERFGKQKAKRQGGPSGGHIASYA